MNKVTYHVIYLVPKQTRGTAPFFFLWATEQIPWSISLLTQQLVMINAKVECQLVYSTYRLCAILKWPLQVGKLIGSDQHTVLVDLTIHNMPSFMFDKTTSFPKFFKRRPANHPTFKEFNFNTDSIEPLLDTSSLRLELVLFSFWLTDKKRQQGDSLFVQLLGV